MGDSNLHRLPAIDVNTVQVDCYPGARLYHAIKILEKLSVPAVHVKRVVLAFGLNNRTCGIDTSTKQAMTMLTKATAAFPHASISIPLINTSPNLSTFEKETIASLNRFLTTHVPIIPLLPVASFSTGRDHIHWTTPTATAMRAHWLNYLN